MTEEPLLVERDRYVCTLTINRPERRNSLTIELLYRLGDVLSGINDDGEVRVVVLRGAGEKAFCAGMDLRGGMAVSEDEMADRKSVV